MCDQCRAEYENPFDRRFHAQPTACPHCGPQLALLDRAGRTLEVRSAALLAAADALRQGRIVALKGLGGYQLLADARNPEAVALLRQRKGRYEKPFAVICPTLTYADGICQISDAERALLQSAAAPIVLLIYTGSEIAPQVAPDNPYLGVMLPYTPLHHLLLDELGFPVVVTSGNISGEPIVIDDDEALAKLGTVADLFLTHSRPIARPVDDSVVFVVEDQPVTLRRARGYVPMPIPYPAVTEICWRSAHSRKTRLRSPITAIFSSASTSVIWTAPPFTRLSKTRWPIFKRCTICTPQPSLAICTPTTPQPAVLNNRA